MPRAADIALDEREASGPSEAIPDAAAAEEIAAAAAAAADRLAQEAELARERAEAMVSQARDEAARILEDAGRQAGAVREKAYNEGFLEGHAEGDRKAAAEFEELARENRAAVERALSAFFAARDAALAEFSEIKGQIKTLVSDIMKKIINFEYENDDKFIDAVIQGALERIKPKGKLTFTVSEADYERFFPSGEAVFNVGGDAITASVAKNPSMGGMDIIVDDGESTVNIGPLTQLQRVESAFEKSGAL
jgi:flagellar biosynthesis/type III secretory pathway protein FliH